MSAQDGAAGMVTLLAVALVVVVASAGIAAAGDFAVTAARARSAADAAALAGIGTSPLVMPAGHGSAAGPQVTPAGHGSADAAARAVAGANRARLVAGDGTGWPLRYGVTVAVEPATRWVRRFVGRVTAEAVAAVRPRVPTSGQSGV